jgi:single-stranded DNA-binding protein
MTVVSSLSRNRSVHAQRDEVEREIRSRRLKYTDLVDELEDVRRQTEQLEIRAEKEYGDVQAAIKAAENSDQEVKRAEMKAMQVIATTRLGVNKILQHRQGQQESLREMVERQKESLRRMSIRDAAGRKINPDDLLRSYEVPEFENPKLNEGNMAKYLHKLEAEKRKEQVKAAVRRGLKRFAAMQKMKKKNPQAAKKTVRLA